MGNKINIQTIKSFIGKNVNLHLYSGDTIINVKIVRVIKPSSSWWRIFYKNSEKVEQIPQYQLKEITAINPLLVVS